ncbi:hypothetical protein SAMN05444671_0438 [Flavobacterium sp. CF108]|nr:hypothetical protein SAMN04487978_2652 [Flavobacterium sp. fv08]SHG44094.1 hypothetical protein SAMN05444671_0438 [Flavobacterium sp. CF108]
MLQKIVLMILLLLSLSVKSQDTNDTEIVEDYSIAEQLYTKCFENLNQGIEIFEKYPPLKSRKFCSLIECMFLYSYKEEDIKFAAEKRLIDIATQLYNAGTPVYLTMGMDSYLYAKEKNENLEDDNHLVYINYGECTNPRFLSDAAEIINRQTLSLIKQSTSK